MEKINDVIFVDVNKIERNPDQPRRIFDDAAIEDLARSIKQVGVIQPINLRKKGEMFELIAGERRLLATKKAGFNKIPAVIIEVNSNESAVLALVENVQREDLNFIEEAYAYQALKEKYNISQKEIAEGVGKSQSTISNKMRLLRLGQSLIDQIKEAQLTERHSRALLKLKNDDDRQKALERIIKNELNVKQTDVLVNRILEDTKIKKKRRNTKFRINASIYVNTIKKAYQNIVDTGVEAKFEKKEHEDYYELKIRIPK